MAAATLSMTQVAHAEPAPPTLPPGAEKIAPPPGNQVFLVGHVPTGAGVQIYKCDGKAWTFVAPRADLVGDDNNKLVIVKHSAGPLWTATDGSSVKGTVLQKATVDQSAVPWLLLSATNQNTGGDRLANTTFIQRVNTVGGLAPTDRCNGATSGTVKEVPYTADYFFWKATGGA